MEAVPTNAKDDKKKAPAPTKKTEETIVPPVTEEWDLNPNFDVELKR